MKRFQIGLKGGLEDKALIINRLSTLRGYQMGLAFQVFAGTTFYRNHTIIFND
jgi:hypothetical protein